MQRTIVISDFELTELLRAVIAPFFIPKENPEVKEKKHVYLTRKEVAKILNITLPTLQKHTESGLLKAHYIGRRVLYDQNELSQSFDNAKAIIVKKKKNM